MARPFFKPVPGAPAPLRAEVRHTVRFGECDPMQVVWHGHYVGYFERAREALAARHGLTFEQFKEAGVALPVKNIFIDYIKPLPYNGELRIEALQHWSDAARIDLEYLIYDTGDALCTKGHTVQLMADMAGGLILDPPPFYKNFLLDWAAGRLRGLSGAE